jgi:hypothetical protein
MASDPLRFSLFCVIHLIGIVAAEGACFTSCEERGGFHFLGSLAGYSDLGILAKE